VRLALPVTTNVLNRSAMSIVRIDRRSSSRDRLVNLESAVLKKHPASGLLAPDPIELDREAEDAEEAGAGFLVAGGHGSAFLRPRP
jgi:hypothetical protein